MDIFLAGGTGVIGRLLLSLLVADGDNPAVESDLLDTDSESPRKRTVDGVMTLERGFHPSYPDWREGFTTL